MVGVRVANRSWIRVDLGTSRDKYDLTGTWKFLPRDARHKRVLCCRAASVCPAEYLSRSCIVSKRLKMVP